MKKNLKFNTNVVHVGSEPNIKEGASGDVNVPIHLSTTFAREKVDIPTGGYEYSRSGNPTRAALENNLAALEKGHAGFAFASGLAAMTTVLFLLKTGDHVISVDDVYGGTRRLFAKVLANFGIEFSFVNFSNGEYLKKHLKKNTKMIWLESPTNPLLNIIDIASVTKFCRRRKILTVVDNTFASPFLQNPLELGADIVVHSTTKYISGHSDSMGGAVIVRDGSLAEKIKFLQNAIGAIMSPFDSYMALRGVKTLSVRMERQENNTIKIVEFLNKHTKVKKVYYPGLTSHIGHKIAKAQMKGFGAMVAFEIKGSIAQSVKFLESLEIIHIAESLGAVESLIEHPASMTHASVPRKEREKIGLTDGLIRLSVGIEDADDLIADLSQSLTRTF